MNWLTPATNRVERRVFVVLFVFTLVPLTVLGYLGVHELERQALDQASSQLRTVTKGYANTLLDRLGATESQLRVLLANVPEHIDEWSRDMGQVKAVSRHIEGEPTGRSKWLRTADGFWLEVPSASGRRRFLLDMDQIWHDIAETPFGSERCAVVGGVEVKCGTSGFLRDAPISFTAGAMLEEVFDSKLSLAVRTSVDRNVALGSVAFVYRLLPIVVAVTGLLVTFVAMRFVRTRLRPLSALHEATLRLQSGDYTHRVAVGSGDEFDALAAAFNEMTQRLDRSFGALKALAQIDRMILSSTPPDEILGRVLAICDAEAGIKSRFVLWRDRPEVGYWLFERTNAELASTALPASIERFEGKLGAIDDFLEQLRAVGHVRFEHWLPVHMEKRLAGVLLIESTLGALPPDLFKKLSDLTDRLAVAVTHFDRAETLYRQAHFDPLTGLINRYAFEDRLKQAVQQARRDNAPGALLFIDLDRFKQVNDTEGHKAGDRLLLHVADRIKRSVRANDTIARLGGDEFAIIVHRFESQAEIITLCERLTAEIAKPLLVDRIEHSIDASIGVSLFPSEGSSVDELLMRADAAMYRAKERSGGSFAFYDEQLNEVTRDRVKMESRLRRALRTEDLQVLFQPQLHLPTQRIVSVEALLRWHDDELGEVSPTSFIPIAEETGLIRDIGPLVLKQSVLAMEQLRAAGVTIDRVAVNTSTKELATEGFAARFVSFLRTLGARPEEFEVEVTESVFIQDAAAVAKELTALRDAGVRVALDDFGTGYSSLNMLRTLPLDLIKIDRSFVVELTQSEEARSLTRNIIQIARALEIGVVAEGTEHDAEIELLASFGCDYAQGYGIARPLTVDELVELMSREAEPAVTPARDRVARLRSFAQGS